MLTLILFFFLARWDVLKQSEKSIKIFNLDCFVLFASLRVLPMTLITQLVVIAKKSVESYARGCFEAI